jgi:O-antigen/teichoic acid export membrane protein
MTVLTDAVFERLSAILNRRLTRNIGWYGAAELAARVTRLATAVIVARVTSRADLGCAAAVLTAFELIRALTNNGIGQAVIRAADRELAAVCVTAHRAVRILCVGVAALQLAVGGALALTGATQAGSMLASLSFVYLLMAPGLVQVYRIQRSNRLHIVAVIATTQMMADNLLTACLAYAGFGAWALILPKLLVAPIWLVGVRRHEPWRLTRGLPGAPISRVLRFAVPVLGTELLNAARLNLDNVMVGSVLGLDALGIYYFVFNAGIGLSLSLTSAMSGALFPHLAEGAPDCRTLLARFDRALPSAVLPVSAVIALQAAASLVYVPLVFGSRWHDAAPLVAMLCASAIARPFADAGCQLLRARGRTRQEFVTMLAVTTLYLGSFGLALTHGLAFAIATLAVVATSLHITVALAARLSVRPSLSNHALAEGVAL